MAETMTTGEVADYLRTSPDTVKRLARDGRLPGIKVGRAWRFRRADLEELFTEGMVDRALADETERRLAEVSEGDLVDWEDVKAQSEKLR